MGLQWFKGWTEPLPLWQFSVEEIGQSFPKGNRWVYESPPLNKWMVEHALNDFASSVVILHYWDDSKDCWHEVYHEHTVGMSWPEIWDQMSTTVGICRESMLP